LILRGNAKPDPHARLGIDFLPAVREIRQAGCGNPEIVLFQSARHPRPPMVL
jgi:hypothetical protein